MKITVAGGTGFVGTELIKSLNDNHETVSISRGESEEADISVEADVTKKEEYIEELEDTEVAYYLIHGMASKGDLSEIERNCAEAFREACTEAGIDRVIYLTGMEHEEEVSEHMKTRSMTGDILSDGEYDFTEIGSAIILGWESSSFQLLYQLSSRLPLMVTPRWLENNVQPIHISDVILYLEKCLENEKTRNEYLEIGGPEILTYSNLLKKVGKLAKDREPLMIEVPVLTPKLSSYWMRLVTDVNYNLARSLVDSIKQDMVVKDHKMEEYIQHECKGLDESINQCLEEGKTN
jgi:uncharacterized protein YbjT (DUF2867 family)